jgi:2'-5' RNA ligase
MALFRGFIAIDIATTPHILSFEKEIQKTGADVKLVEPNNIHITIKFLGDTDENHIDAIEQSMKESVLGVNPFPITLKGTGVFPNQNYLKVIWIGILDEGHIKTISQTIDNKLALLGFKKENRGFSPHLTIGRVRTAKKKEQLLSVVAHQKETEFAVQTVQSLYLKKSELTPQGPIYTTLREVPL